MNLLCVTNIVLFSLAPKSVNLEVRMLENDELDQFSDKTPLLFDSESGSKYLVTVNKIKE